MVEIFQHGAEQSLLELQQDTLRQLSQLKNIIPQEALNLDEDIPSKNFFDLREK